MSDNLNRQYLFVLPMPVSAPGVNGTLYGIAYAVTDAYFNIVGNKEIITCKGVDYRLPSPSYLFSLGIDPFTISKGLSECDFLDKVSALLSNPNVDIFTWSSRNLGILQSMAYRNIHEFNLLKNTSCIIDINRVLKMHELFTNGQIFNSDALIACAKKYGLQSKLNNFSACDRLDALIHIVKCMCQQNAAMVSFMLKSTDMKKQMLQSSIASGKFLVDYNVKEHCLEVLKPLYLYDDYLEALYYDGANVLKKYYPLSDFPVFSPSAVLTQDRQALTGVNLNEAIFAINAVDQKKIQADESTLPLGYSFFSKLTDNDLAVYREYLPLKKESLSQAPLSCSQSFRNLVFMLRGSNFTNTLLDNELQIYYKKCSSSIQAQLAQYVQEFKGILGRVNENDAEQLKLVEKIRAYPEKL